MKKIQSLVIAAFIASFPLSSYGVQWIGPVNIFTTEFTQGPVVGVDNTANAVIFANASDNLTVYYEKGAQLINGVAQNFQNYTSVFSDGISQDTSNEIAVNASGNALATWVEFDDINMKNTMHAAVLSNGIWGSATTVSNAVLDNVEDFFGIGVTLDNSNNGISAWISSNMTNNKVQIAQYVSSIWTPVQDIFTSVDTLTGLDIAGSPSGKALLIWGSFSMGLSNLESSYYNGTSWINQTISTDLIQHCIPPIDVAMNASNQAMVAWLNQSVSGVSAVSFLNGVFGTPQLVYTPDLLAGEAISEVAVAINDLGSSIVTWILSDSLSNYKVLASRFLGSSWSMPVTVASVTSPNEFRNLNIGMDKLGNAYVVWEQSDNMNQGSIYFSEYTKSSQSWSPTPLLLSTAGTSSTNPKLSMNAFGGATVVWSQDAIQDTIQAIYTGNTLSNPNPAQNLSGKQVKNRFLTQTEFINVLNWSPSSTPGVVSYSIFRNGIQIAVIPAEEPLTYEDHNRRKGKVYTYQIFSVDAGGNRSVPATITVP